MPNCVGITVKRVPLWIGNYRLAPCNIEEIARHVDKRPPRPKSCCSSLEQSGAGTGDSRNLEQSSELSYRTPAPRGFLADTSGTRRGCSAALRGEKARAFRFGYLMTRPTANSKHGTRYEIAVGGKPRSYRDVKAVAIESAQDLKSRNPNIEVAVLDLENGETIVIKNRPPRQPNDRAP